MSIVVTCPSCSVSLKAPDAAAGKRVKCPKCTSTIEVPAAAPPPSAFDEFTDEAPAVSAKGGALQPYEKEEEADDAASAAPPSPPPADWESNRQTVGLLAILVGFLGIHKFVLGNNTPALITLLVSLLTCGVGYPVMWAIGMVEGVRYLRMSDAEFYQTYVVGKKAWL
jgi:TM2 domain-containing membrane protein YozV